MKVFEVKFEIADSKGGPGALMMEHRYYAAHRAEQVWEAIALDRLDEAMRFDSLREIIPAVQILAVEAGGEHG